MQEGGREGAPKIIMKEFGSQGETQGDWVMLLRYVDGYAHENIYKRYRHVEIEKVQRR